MTAAAATVTAAQRKMFAKMGIAMSDGTYYVRNLPDLENAIESVTQGDNSGASGDAIRKHIISRASALKMSDKIPNTWNSDGSMKHAEVDLDDFLEHFGVKGMRWGSRKSRPTGEPSEDAARTGEILEKVKKARGTHTLTNDELKKLNERLNLEQNYSRLVSGEASPVAEGEKFVKDNLGRVKLAVDGVETGIKVYKLGNSLHKAIKDKK